MHFLRSATLPLALAIVFLALATPVLAASPRCARPRLRKEIRDLTDSEWAAFTDAMNQLKRSGRIDQYVAIHQQWTQPAHFGMLFLAWHRRFLWQLETEIIAITGDRLPGLPFFDPHYSYSVFDPSSPRFIGEGNGCIMSGPFRGWWGVEGRCVARAMGQTPANFVDPRALAQLAMADAAFSDYARTYENSQHADVHSTIGGQMATLQYSVNDVAFFLHHAHVDQVWYKRQMADMGRLYWDYSGVHEPAGIGMVTLNTRIPPWQDPVGAVVDVYNTLCVDYQDSHAPAPPQLRKRSVGGHDEHDQFAHARIFNFTRTDPLRPCVPLPAERLAPLGVKPENAQEACDLINKVIDEMRADGRPVDEWPLPHEIGSGSEQGTGQAFSPAPRFALAKEAGHSGQAPAAGAGERVASTGVAAVAALLMVLGAALVLV